MARHIRLPMHSMLMGILLSVLHAAFGQVATAKYSSPPAYTSAVIGSTELDVSYYAPSTHGRQVFGGLVPFGKLWCPGANVATTLRIRGRVRVGTVTVEEGSYSLWVVPKPRAWLLIINRQSGQFHLAYDPTANLGTTRMHVRTIDNPTETLVIAISGKTPNTGELSIAWEHTEASAPLRIMAGSLTL